MGQHKELMKRVQNAFKGVVSGENIVFTKHSSRVVTVDGSSAPFIRLTTTSNTPVEKMIGALRKGLPEIDMEVMVLEDFYPGKQRK